MGTTILSFQNRLVIETLHNEGRSLRYIANYLGFSKTTVFNELHRLNGEYQAELAQTDFERKVSQLHDKLKTLIVDHGKEFANYQTIEQITGTQVYFAHAYSPHERGSNENRNRVLRRFIPKGQAIEELSDRQLNVLWYRQQKKER